MKTKLSVLTVSHRDIQHLEMFLNLNAEAGWFPLKVNKHYSVFGYDPKRSVRYTVLFDPSAKLTAYGKDDITQRQHALDEVLQANQCQRVFRLKTIAIYEQPNSRPPLDESDFNNDIILQLKRKVGTKAIRQSMLILLMAYLMVFGFRNINSVIGASLFDNRTFIVFVCCVVLLLPLFVYEVNEIRTSMRYLKGEDRSIPEVFTTLVTPTYVWVKWFIMGAVWLVIGGQAIFSSGLISFLGFGCFVYGVYRTFVPFYFYSSYSSESLIKRFSSILPQSIGVLALTCLAISSIVFTVTGSLMPAKASIENFNFSSLNNYAQANSCTIHEQSSIFTRRTYLDCTDNIIQVFDVKTDAVMPFVLSAVSRWASLNDEPEFIEDKVVSGRMFPTQYLKSRNLVVFGLNDIPDDLVQEIIER